ncbi:hypothetical protein A4A49_00621 [Nicotiana attenuata]|uniref:Uncharacterized protein n=1 Tax=Nicotiana attenuata TaxID=49451 RepID=A0A1J6IFF8_NICAT|nr:hypothetical protein A4A49_00621 [Nicotiana attenuata]
MEISSMFHSKMALSSPLFSSSSFPTSSRKRPNIHKFKLQSSTSAATKITTDSIPRTEAGEFQNVLTDYVSPNSQFPVSRNDRQSAILQIQESSDLGSALPRLGETLKVQDMNVILRYFGKLSRRQELSQVLSANLSSSLILLIIML